MGKRSPSAPPAPDPAAVAQAQTGSNVNTAVANSILGNANEVSPYGTVTYRQIGSQRVGGGNGGLYGLNNGGGNPLSGGTADRALALAGRPGGGAGMYGGGDGGYDIPQFERRVELSPEQQQLYDQQTRLGSDMNNLAISQVGRLNNVLGQPINADSLPQRGTLPGSGPRFASLEPGRAIQHSIGPTDYSEDRRRVEEAILSRFNPQLDRDRDALETKLVNQGFARGTDPFNTEMDAIDRSATDARMQAILAGGQEQTRLADLALQSGTFANTAQAQDFNQNLQRTGFNNDTLQRGFSNDINLAQTQDTSRERALQELLSMRNQPINEVSALMSGGQVTAPQFAQYRGGTIDGTPIGQYTYQTAGMNADAFQAEQARRASTTNALIGGIAGLGGAGLYGLAGGRFGAPTGARA